jgi:Na+/H+-dicarboxylate symporter
MKIRISLPLQILLALISAVFIGIFIPEVSRYTAWLGTIFIRALKMIVAPLVFTSLICGISRLNSGKDFGRLGFKTLAWYIGSSMAAIFTGLILVNIVKPGIGAELGFKSPVNDLAITSGSLADNLIGIVPDNIFKALAETDMLAIIFVAILFAFAISQLQSSYKSTMIKFFDAGNELIMKITSIIIRFSPIGIFGIVISIVASHENLSSLVYRLGLFMLVVLAGLIIHSMITMTVLLRIAGKVNPVTHVKAMITPLLTAFSTSSSNATLPLTMTAMEKNAGVSGKLTSFTLPLGATINMDGTALYEIVAALFIAQAYGIELSTTQQIIAALAALMASIGAAGVPMAGMVTMGIVLTAVGLPLEGIGLILAVDRILDMFRTSVNVWGDTVVCAIIATSEGEKVYENVPND